MIIYIVSNYAFLHIILFYERDRNQLKMLSDSTVPPDVMVAGVAQSKKHIKSGTAKKAYVAYDADKKIRDTITDMCRDAGIEADSTYSLEQLGRMCGIEVNCAVCVVL